MSIIDLNNIKHEFGSSLLFENINLVLDKNTKAGLVGRNGTGKSTLFKIITRQLQAKDGLVNGSKSANVSYLSQEFDFECSDQVFHWLLTARQDILDLKAEIDKLNIILETDHSEKILDQLANVQHEFEVFDGYNYENTIKTMLTVFNFTEDYFTRPVESLSGGEKTRLRLIHTLLEKHDLLLLDEPTNHLDIRMIDWLIGYLKSLDCGYLLISHDRYFLDQTVNKIYELRGKTIQTYSGNYSAFETESSLRQQQMIKQFEQQQKLIDKTEDFIRRNMAGQKVNQAKSRLKMLDRMDVLDKPNEDKQLRIKIEPDKRSGNDIFRLENVKYGFTNKVLGSNIDLYLHYRDKVCLLGPNGCGKTTFIKLLLGDIEPLSGIRWTGAGLSIGYYDQLHFELDLDKTIMETIWELVPNETIGYVLGYLAKFGFTGDKVEQLCSSLSGGEKARLYLAKMIHEKPNLLILDEPTNHLDISMIRSLEEALQDYDGTILFVSHDRYFIKGVAQKVWMFKDQSIYESIEDPDDLINQIILQNSDNDSKKNNLRIPLKNSKKQEKQKKINPWVAEKLLKDIENKENEILQIMKEIEELQTRFSDSSTYNKTELVKEINKQIDQKTNFLKRLKNDIDDMELKYLELTEQ